MRFKLNPLLTPYLVDTHTTVQQLSSPDPSELSDHRHRRWKIRDRLSERQIASIVKDYKAGTAKHVLAGRYGVAVGSIKKLLREEGIKRRSQKDVQG